MRKRLLKKFAFPLLQAWLSAGVLGLLAFGSTTTTAADQFEDRLLSTPGTPSVIAKGLESDAYQLAVSAYTWGYPLVRMERVAREYTDVPSQKPNTSYRAPLNQIGWATELATPVAKDMPTANNDTFYMSAVVNLDEPYVLSVPDTDDRYYVINVFNMWQELEHYIGRRTTGTKAGRFAIVPPGWTGQLPEDIKRLDMSTSKVWLGFVSVSFERRYDFALSFAGADREIAELLFAGLTEREVAVFYDKNEQHRILAQDVEQYLRPIYQSEAQFVVVLLGKEYPKRIWTRIESETFKERFEQGAVIPIWLSNVDQGAFDASRDVGGITWQVDGDRGTQAESICELLVRKLMDSR